MLKAYKYKTDKQEFVSVEKTEVGQFSNIWGSVKGVDLQFTSNHCYMIAEEHFVPLTLVNFSEVKGVDFLSLAAKLRDTSWEKLPKMEQKMLVTAISNFKCDGITETGEVVEVRLNPLATAKAILAKADRTKGKGSWKKLDREVKALSTTGLITKVILLIQEILVLNDIELSELTLKGTMSRSFESK